MNIKNLYHYWREIKMSCLHNEEILENLFEQIQEEYPTLSENEQVKLAEKMFDDLMPILTTKLTFSRIITPLKC